MQTKFDLTGSRFVQHFRFVELRALLTCFLHKLSHSPSSKVKSSFKSPFKGLLKWKAHPNDPW